MSKIIESLGIYGIPEHTENAILTSILSGDPALMIGPPGTAKTETVDMLGAILREASKKKYKTSLEAWEQNGKKDPKPTPENIFDFQVYDSSKLNFEDLVGIINIEAMKTGKIEYIKTPSTIWNKKLVSFDEFNRIDPDRQSNLMEIIRSRRCMGEPTGTLFIINSMNPFGDSGTQLLSEALVDRHAMFITFPDFTTMEQNDRLRIIGRVGNSDAIGYKAWSGEKFEFDSVKSNIGVINEALAQAGEKLIALMQKALSIYKEVTNQYSDQVKYLISRTFEALNSSISALDGDKKGSLLSGRRGGLALRSILLYRAVEIAKSQLYGTPLNPLVNSILCSYPMCMPFGISGNLDTETSTRLQRQLIESIQLYWPQIESGKSVKLVDRLFELFGTTSIYRKIEILLTDEVPETISNSAWNLVLTYAKDKKLNVETLMAYLIMLDEKLIPTNVRGRLDIPKIENVMNTATTLQGSLNDIKPDIERLYASANNKPVIQYFIASAINEYNNKVISLTEAKRLLDGLTESIDKITKLIDRKIAKINDSNKSDKDLVDTSNTISYTNTTIDF